MKIGNRVIKGSIKKREEARDIYEAAKARGNVASLLDQERPNIFTQAVANIEPGENVDIEIKYVNVLKFEDGTFTFNFPTVVGPRFILRSAPAYKNDLIPDGAKITPPMAAEGERAGHDISIDLNINAGVPIQSLKSKLHDVDQQITASTTAHMKLKSKDKIPNRDFVATWTVASDSVQSGYLTHRSGDEGFFTLMLIPPKRVTPTSVQPKEMIFVVDCSGSQNGAPIEKAKETLEYIAKHMNPHDTFQIITFNSGVQTLAEQPLHASAAAKQEALDFIHNIHAAGGTWMAPAVKKACTMPNDDHRLRIITFMTDGYVGNDMEVLDLIKTYRGDSRWFSFGTGNSVNRFLIDGIAREGGGEADYVLLNSSAEEVGKKFYDRISSPVLTDIKVQFEGVQVKEVFPKDISDLWAQRPLNFTGRYTKPGTGKAILTGWSAGKPYRQEIKLDFPASQDANDVLPSIWARAKVDRLMHENWRGVQFGSLPQELKDEIIATALKYHIMSQYTSFVAVEENSKTSPEKAKTVAVEVETPQGVHAESFSPPNRLKSSYSNKSILLHSNHLAPGTLTGAGLGTIGSYGGAPTNAPYAGAGGVSSAGAPAPVRAGTVEHYSHYEPGAFVGRQSEKKSEQRYGSASGLPAANMGKFVHQPGDNQYVPSQQSYQAPSYRGYGGGAYGGKLPSAPSTGVHGSLMSRTGGSLPPTILSSSLAQTGMSDKIYGDESAEGPSGTGSGYGEVGGEISTKVSAAKKSSGNIAPYRKELLQTISKELPPEVGAFISGTVQFAVSKNGKVKNAEVLESTGNPKKDALIKSSIEKMQFAPLPDWFKGQELTFKIDLTRLDLTLAKPEQMIKQEDAEKLDKDLLAKLDKWRKSKKPNDLTKVKIKVELTETPGSALLEQLHRAGLDIFKHKDATAYGTIAFKDIGQLVKLSEVKLIHPDQ
jgi:TonB family protein